MAICWRSAKPPSPLNVVREKVQWAKQDHVKTHKQAATETISGVSVIDSIRQYDGAAFSCFKVEVIVSEVRTFVWHVEVQEIRVGHGSKMNM